MRSTTERLAENEVTSTRDTDTVLETLALVTINPFWVTDGVTLSPAYVAADVVLPCPAEATERPVIPPAPAFVRVSATTVPSVPSTIVPAVVIPPPPVTAVAVVPLSPATSAVTVVPLSPATSAVAVVPLSPATSAVAVVPLSPATSAVAVVPPFTATSDAKMMKNYFCLQRRNRQIVFS